MTDPIQTPFISRWYSLLPEAIRRFSKLGHKTHAAALTFTTLFALVPVLTVMYSALSLLPSMADTRQDLENALLSNLVPASGDALMGYLYQFSEQAKKLTAVGIVFLFITAYLMLRTIEETFNKVWQLEHGRKGLSGFLLYWAVMSLGPLMLGSGLAVSSYVASLSLWQSEWVPSYGVQLLTLVAPFITSFATFSLIYWAVPNCHVPLRHAMAGGLFTALVFEIGKEIFAELTTVFPSYQLIYGAFAAVPLFLLWLYISWAMILLGAELVYLMGYRQSSAGVQHDLESRSDAIEYETWHAGLLILSEVHRRQNQEAKPTDPVQLFGAIKGLIPDTLHRSVNYLCDMKYLRPEVETAEHDTVYWLIPDPGQITLQDYLDYFPAVEWKDEPIREFLEAVGISEEDNRTTLSSLLIKLREEEGL